MRFLLGCDAGLLNSSRLCYIHYATCVVQDRGVWL